MLKRLMSIITILLVLFLPNNTNCSETGIVLHFLSVGQGDCAIIQSGKQCMIIDGGKSKQSSLIYSYLRKTLGIKHIDYMVATHPHEDHIGGLSGALNACSLGKIYSSCNSYDSKAFMSLKKYLNKQKLDINIPQNRESFMLGEAKVEFLSLNKPYNNLNDTSLVLKITYKNTRFLFTGDIEWEAEHDLVESGQNLSADVLKAPHHGSNTSSSYVFLKEVAPKYAVVSCGEGNNYDHPTDDVLSRYKDCDCTVYRLDEYGHIICKSDGNTIEFINQKKTQKIVPMFTGI